MVLAVAGLDDAAVADLTRDLARGWPTATAAERVAFDFTAKQAKDPGGVTRADLRRLERHFDRGRAWQIAWWSSRCHYMTQVADAFQIPLESDNPFWSMPGATRPDDSPPRRAPRRGKR